MSSTYSPLKIQLMATGENNTTWGDITNLNLGTALEEAIVGSADVTFASADVTLTLTDTNTSQTARNMRLRFTGTTGGASRTLIVPSIEKPYIVKNDCADDVIIRTAAGVGITVPTGKTMWVYSDATNVVDAVTHLSSLTLASALSVPSGGTGATTFTANGVVYGNTASSLLVTAAGTTGQVLVGNTGGAPSWATLTGIGVTSFSAGTTGLTPSTATTGAITLAGTLGVANGGTGTTTAFTAGSVVFAGASGVYSQDNANFFWDDTNNRLGIGTATPGSNLVVAGSNVAVGSGGITRITSTTAAAVNAGGSLAFHGNAAQVGIGLGEISGRSEGGSANDRGYLSFATNGASYAERMRINSDGNVGIGTTSPATKLHVNKPSQAPGDTTPSGALLVTNTTAGAGCVEIGSGSPVLGYLQVRNTDNQTYYDFALQPNGGNVGIGTTNPAMKLDVRGGAFFGVSASTLPAATGSGLYINYETPNTRAYIGDASGYSFRFASRTGSATTDIMTVQDTGNVGIGTTSPTAQLHLAGPAEIKMTNTTNTSGYDIGLLGGSSDANAYVYQRANAALIFGTNNNDRMRIDSSGNVGIGTSSPTAKLDVYSGASSTAAVFNSTTNTYIQLQNSGTNGFYIQSASTAAYLWNQLNTPLLFATNNTEKMRIDASGNVGIGTGTPSYQLEVRQDGASTLNYIGSVNTTATGNYGAGFLARAGSGFSYFYMRGDGLAYVENATANPLAFATNGTEKMRITSSGNVGIGTSAPTEKLDVVGNIYASGSIQAYGTGSIGTNLQLRSVGASPNIQFNRPSYQNWFMGSPDVSPDLYIAEGTSSTYRMYFASGGNVGIGTTSPTYKLVVSNGGANGFELDPSTGIFQTYNRSTSAYSGLLIYAADQRFFTGTSPAERMRINSAGQVMVGTTTANGIFGVVGDQISVGNAAGSSALGIQIKGTALAAIPAAQIQAYIATGDSTMGVAGDLLIAPRTDVVANIRFITGTTPAERMRILADGNVLVGRATAYVQPYRMVVNGDSALSAIPMAINDDRSGTADSRILAFLRGGTETGYITSTNNTLAIAGSTTLTFQTVSSEQMRITNTGNVGIGTSSPVYKLDVSGSVGVVSGFSGGHYNMAYATDAASRSWRIVNDLSAYGDFVIQQSTTRTGSTYAAKFYIDASGNVGIGTSSPTAKLDVYDAAGGKIIFRNASGQGQLFADGSSLVVSADSNIPMIFRTNTTERMRIDSSGKLLVGSSSNVGSELILFKQSGASTAPVTRVWNNETSGNNEFIEFATETAYTSRGSITYNRAGGLVAYNVTSDYRAKDIIGSVTDAGATIDALKVYAGKMHGATITRPMLIAHEAQSVAPYSVTGEKDAVNEDGSPNYQQIDHSALIPLLIAEIQSLRARVAQLEGN